MILASEEQDELCNMIWSHSNRLLAIIKDDDYWKKDLHYFNLKFNQLSQGTKSGKVVQSAINRNLDDNQLAVMLNIDTVMFALQLKYRFINLQTTIYPGKC